MASMKSERRVITLIGTGCIGASIGMALRASPDAAHLEIVGHDKDLGTARKAQKAGALDRVEYNLDLALKNARLVVLAVPLAELRETLTDVGQLLPPDSGVVITDTAPLKAPVREWAAAALPGGTHYVGGDPFLAPGVGGWEPLHGVESARADLFNGAVYALAMAEDDHSSAVKAVANLARVLGASPLFMDPVEHDAVRALTLALPDLLATALLRTTAGSPGWAEMRKAADRSFATATAAVEGDPASRRMLALLSREVLLQRLESLQDELVTLQAALESGNAETLDSAFEAARETRSLWMAESRLRAWDTEQAVGLPDASNFFRLNLETLLGALARKDNRGRGPWTKR